MGSALLQVQQAVNLASLELSVNSKLMLQWRSFWEAQSALTLLLESPCDSAGKESACNAGELGSIPGLGRCPAGGKGYPLQYSGLENSVDCTVHGVTKSQTRLSNFPSLTQSPLRAS